MSCSCIPKKERDMRRLFKLLLVLVVLVAAAAPGRLAASQLCPQSCLEAVQWCIDACGGCPIQSQKCFASGGCVYLWNDCVCNYETC
jgi:hypothetical protein